MEAFCARRASHSLAAALTPVFSPLRQQSRAMQTSSLARCTRPLKHLHLLRAVQPAEAAEKAEEYNRSMTSRQSEALLKEVEDRLSSFSAQCRQMGWENSNPYEYHPERGLYYHEVARNLICGSQPQTREDIEYLHGKEHVTNIVNLQEDKDFGYWGVDFQAYSSRARELGMFLDRRPIVDFDGNSLRRALPAIVKTLDGALSAGGRVYIHCTAGLGRAPAACIAWMYWFGNRQLDEAYSELTDIRPCGPRRDAIRAATYDLLDSRGWQEFQNLPSDAWATLSESDREHLQDRLWKQQ